MKSSSNSNFKLGSRYDVKKPLDSYKTKKPTREEPPKARNFSVRSTQQRTSFLKQRAACSGSSRWSPGSARRTATTGCSARARAGSRSCAPTTATRCSTRVTTQGRAGPDPGPGQQGEAAHPGDHVQGQRQGRALQDAVAAGEGTSVGTQAKRKAQSEFDESGRELH